MTGVNYHQLTTRKRTGTKADQKLTQNLMPNENQKPTGTGATALVPSAPISSGRDSMLRDIKLRGGNASLIEMTNAMDNETLKAFHASVGCSPYSVISNT